MPKPDLKRGDTVRFTKEWYGVKEGTVAKIRIGPREVCVDHHKGYYEWVVDLDAENLNEVECDHLELADVISRLGGITD